MRAVADIVNSNYDKLTIKKWSSTRKEGDLERNTR
jgi:hypothetical protein